MYRGYLENLNDLLEEQKISPSTQSFNFWYRYWKNALYDIIVHIFKWNTNGEIPNTEIEKILMRSGTIGITDKAPKNQGKLVAYFGNECGAPTLYFDMWKKYQVLSPKWSRVLTINKDIAVGWNTSTKMSAEALIHTVAVELAHTDVSIINYLINSREKSVPIAGSKAQLKELEKYRENLSNGAVTPIYSPAMKLSDFKTIPSSGTANLAELFEFKRNTIELFLQNVGIKTSHEKKGNMIEEEVSANDRLLIFNTEDMFERRKDLRDAVNNLFGRNWTVEKDEALNYDLDVKGVGLNGYQSQQTVESK